MKLHKLLDRCTALLLALSLLLLLAACGGNDTTAATMHLRRTEGTVSVSDGDGKDVPVLDDLGLYSGYGVNTNKASYAWIDLDDVKLAKMDQNSEISIQKEGKALEIEVTSGSLFFNVTQPLEDDETMNITASTMLVGIRGTCGWVEQRGRTSYVYLLEGKVECSAGEQTVTVNAGEMAQLTADGELRVSDFTTLNVPEFILNDLMDDEELSAGIYEASGLDILNAAAQLYDMDNYYNVLRSAQPGDVITLTKDSEMWPTRNTGISIRGGDEDNPIILDLNGYTLTMTEYFSFNVVGTVIIRDSSGAGTGTLVLRTHIQVQNSSCLYLDSGTISYDTSIVVWVGGENINSSFIMNGGTINGGGEHEGSYHRGTVLVAGNSTFTMNGGTVNGKLCAVQAIDNSTFIQNGGTVNGTSYAVQLNGENTEFIQNGGTANGTYGTVRRNVFG